MGRCHVHHRRAVGDSSGGDVNIGVEKLLIEDHEALLLHDGIRLISGIGCGEVGKEPGYPEVGKLLYHLYVVYGGRIFDIVAYATHPCVDGYISVDDDAGLLSRLGNSFRVFEIAYYRRKSVFDDSIHVRMQGSGPGR